MKNNRVLRLSQISPEIVLTLHNETVPVPKGDEVLVRLCSIGLNRADLLYQQQRYFEKPRLDSRLGFEGAGIVEEAGPNALFEPGDRVGICPMAIDVHTQGCLADYGIYRSDQLIPTPASIDDAHSGALWMALLTAWGGLCDAGALQAKETVLITAASSAVGIACIQLAKAIGARVIATSSSEEKCAFLLETGADDVLVQPRDQQALPEFETQLLSLAPEGIDLSFDAVTGPGFRALIRAARRGGRIVVHGYLDRRPMDVHPGVLMKRLLTLKGYTLDATLSRPEQKAKAIAYLGNLLEQGLARPMIARTFSLEEAAKAFEFLASNQQLGKVLITP
ncbi:MAG: NADPH:quinone reductase [Oleiphilus sp.]|nr:MAG: NADPH:quinone reductase [Oleiphilus sp.]